jgi:hypothetical protein
MRTPDKAGMPFGNGARYRPVLFLATLALLFFAAGLAAQPSTNKHYCAKDGTNLMFVIDVTTWPAPHHDTRI